MSAEPMEIYLSVMEETAEVGDVISVMISNLIPHLPYGILVNGETWIDEFAGADGTIVYHNFTCPAAGIYTFKAWLVILHWPYTIWSNEDVLTVFTGPTNGPPPNDDVAAPVTAAGAIILAMLTVSSILYWLLQ